MNDHDMPEAATSPSPPSSRSRTRHARTAALVAGGLLAGGMLAGTLTAAAADEATPSSSESSSGSTSATPGQPPQRGEQGQPPSGPGGAAPVRDDEKDVTGSDAEKIKAAALEAVAGGTVYRVETDAGDAAYEAHMTKADGTQVTVKFNENLAVIEVQDGMGQGDPAPAGQGRPGQDQQAPQSTATAG